MHPMGRHLLSNGAEMAAEEKGSFSNTGKMKSYSGFPEKSMVSRALEAVQDHLQMGADVRISGAAGDSARSVVPFTWV